MDEKTPGATEPEKQPEANQPETDSLDAAMMKGTEEIIASDGTPEIISAESVTEATEVPVTETVAQEVAGAPVPPPPPTTGVPSAGAPVPPPPPSNVATAVPASAAPSATGALVCGILAIVFSGFTIAGIALGIVAIVLAGKYFKAGGTQGTGKGARICGIIGIALSIIWLIAAIVLGVMAFNFANDYDVSSPYSSSSSLGSDAEMDAEEGEAAAEAVAMRLQQIKDHDPAMIATITEMAEESFENEFDYLVDDATMSACGIDPKDYMDIMLKDFDYEFVSFEMASSSSKTKGTATFAITSMDMYQMSSNFNDAIDELNDAGGLSGTEAQQRQQIGDLVMSVLRETGTSRYNFFEVDMVNQNGVWVIDEDSWDEEIEYYFTLS